MSRKTSHCEPAQPISSQKARAQPAAVISQEPVHLIFPPVNGLQRVISLWNTGTVDGQYSEESVATKVGKKVVLTEDQARQFKSRFIELTEKDHRRLLTKRESIDRILGEMLITGESK